MSGFGNSFDDFIRESAELLGLPEPTIEDHRYMFKVGDRWIELRHEAGDARVTFAALVYIAPPELELNAHVVCQFNTFHLFNGGFSLVPGADETLYLCRPHRLASLDPRGLKVMLFDFAKTASMAGTWYIRSLDAAEAVSAAPQLPDTSNDLGIRI